MGLVKSITTSFSCRKIIQPKGHTMRIINLLSFDLSLGLTVIGGAVVITGRSYKFFWEENHF